MPSMSLPQHPTQLAAAAQQQQQQGQGIIHPGLLGGQRPGGQAPPPPNALPAFPGGQDPGVYATPAPFNPYLAAFGGMAGATGGLQQPIMSRAPMGGFDLAPEKQHPGRFNPYASR